MGMVVLTQVLFDKEIFARVVVGCILRPVL